MGHAAQGFNTERACLFKTLDRLFHIGPGGILREDSAHRDLQGTIPRPPVEIAVMAVEAAVDPHQLSA